MSECEKSNSFSKIEGKKKRNHRKSYKDMYYL